MKTKERIERLESDIQEIKLHLGIDKKEETKTEEKREPKVGEWWYGESEKIHFKVKITEISNDWVRVEYYGKTHFDMRKGCVPHNCLLRPATDKEIEQALRSYLEYKKGQGYTHFKNFGNVIPLDGEITFNRSGISHPHQMYVNGLGIYNDHYGWSEFIKSPQEKVITLDGGTEVKITKQCVVAGGKRIPIRAFKLLLSDLMKHEDGEYLMGDFYEIKAIQIGCETVTIDQLKSIINAFEELQR